MQALARRDHDVGRACRTLAAAAAVGGDRACPVGGRARHQIGAGEIGAQALAGLQLMCFDEGAAVAAAPAGEPGERAFGVRRYLVGFFELFTDFERNGRKTIHSN